MLTKIRECNIAYHSFGESDRSAMPIGNGELAASVWTEQDGAVCMYLSRTDALTELDRTVKLGKIRLCMNPCPFEENFVQWLELAEGKIVLKGENGCLEIFCDRETDAVYLHGTLSSDSDLQIEYINWRTDYRAARYEKAKESPDHLLPLKNELIFYHKNEVNIIEETAKLQKLDQYIHCMPDFLTGRIFGGKISCTEPAEVEGNKLTLRKKKEFTICIHTKSEIISEPDFVHDLLQMPICDVQTARERTKEYWNSYWQKSYIFVEKDMPRDNNVEADVLPFCKEPMEYTCACTSPVTRAYVLTKYMFACCDSGHFPVLYNGMLFNLMPGNNENFSFYTFGRCFSAQPGAISMQINPDERSWTIEHLWQNLRHPYYSMLARGEYERVYSLFAYFRRYWELNRVRAKAFYGAEGQHNTEMNHSFGLQSMDIYGVNREDLAYGYSENRSGGAVDISPGLELLTLMLDYYSFVKDAQFLETELIPYAKELLLYISTRFKNRHNGKLAIGPLQAVETYWDTYNPVTVISGLHSVIKRILELPTTEQDFFRMYWELLPELPLSHRNGKTYLAPAEAYDPEKKWNVEPVELYAVFPFRLFGFAKENYDLILDTFYSAIKEGGQDRPFSIGETPGASSYSGWQSVGTCAALLGLSEKCGEILSQNCALTNPGTRFPAMWGPIYDAVPDVDHGANILTQLQTMVMQVEGSKIYILPAFPDKWNVSFRLYADKDTVVEASYRDGKLKDVSVEPKIRQKDLVLLKEEG